uniref:Uncharacterized protein n=1 Tax=Setaria italica TaxID=4555 RepID=K3Y423_SETIT
MQESVYNIPPKKTSNLSFLQSTFIVYNKS